MAFRPSTCSQTSAKPHWPEVFVQTSKLGVNNNLSSTNVLPRSLSESTQKLGVVAELNEPVTARPSLQVFHNSGKHHFPVTRKLPLQSLRINVFVLIRKPTC